jgi:hypothetical protein
MEFGLGSDGIVGPDWTTSFSQTHQKIYEATRNISSYLGWMLSSAYSLCPMNVMRFVFRVYESFFPMSIKNHVL